MAQIRMAGIAGGGEFPDRIDSPITRHRHDPSSMSGAQSGGGRAGRLSVVGCGRRSPHRGRLRDIFLRNYSTLGVKVNDPVLTIKWRFVFRSDGYAIQPRLNPSILLMDRYRALGRRTCKILEEGTNSLRSLTK